MKSGKSITISLLSAICLLIGCQIRPKSTVDNFFIDIETEDSSKIKKALPQMFYDSDSLKYEYVDNVVKRIAEYNRLDGPMIGYGASLSKQYKRFEKLTTIKEDSVLVKLTGHSNAVVRCYAFNALVSKRSPHCLPVFLNHLKDTATVQALEGCMGRFGKANIEFLLALTPDTDTVRMWIAFDKSDFAKYSRLLHYNPQRYF